MKIFLIITIFLSLILSSLIAKNDTFSEGVKSKIIKYDKLFTQISEKRLGISNSKINEVKNPFIMARKGIKIKDSNSTSNVKKIYILNAIFDKKAKINGQWYKINNEIDDFKIVSIRIKSVIIKNEHSKKELFIRKSNVSKIKFSSK